MSSHNDDPALHPRFETRGVNALHLIHKWSIEHPYIVISFYLGMIILAVLAIGFRMPRRFMPYVESPMIGVVTMMPGLSAEEMESYVSKPIEEQLVNVKNLHYIRSTSQDGFSIVSLEFNYGVNMQKALFDVQSLMNFVQANLPATGANTKPSWVLAIDPLNLPVLSLAVTGDKRWDMVSLREFVDNDVMNKLKTVPNVYSVVPFGGFKRQLQVIVDRNKLAAYGISILDVRNSIDAYNVSRTAGNLTTDTSESIVRIDTKALDAQTVMNYPIKSVSDQGDSTGTNTSGQPKTIYVKDVATVKDTYWERRSGYHYFNKGKITDAIEASIIQDPGGSSAQVVPAVQKVLRQLETDNPGVKFDVAYDNSRFVNILFKNMFDELGIAILLTGIIILLFLGEWRGTLISLITIPVSLAIAILALLPMGMTLNSGTLIGLLLSIGRLVDDSIIDIHAVERHMRMGKDPKTATIDGIAEVRLAVISSTIMLVLALSPLLFCGGITELMFRELVWPIIFGLMASMLVSFTLTALLCANILKPHSELVEERKKWFYTRLLNPIQDYLERMEIGYGKVIRWMLMHRFSNMTRILITVIIGFTFYHFIGSEMMPLADVGQAYGVLEMDPGASYAETERAVTSVERIFAKYREVEKISTEIGTETMFESFSPLYTGYAMPLVGAASFMITLSDKDSRKRDMWQIIDGVQKEALETIPGIRRLQIKEMGSDVMASSLAPVSLIVYGKDLDQIAMIGKKVEEIAKSTPGLYQVASSWEMDKPTYNINIIPEKAQALGLTPEEISQQAFFALRGGVTNEWYRPPNVRQDTVLIRYAKDSRQNESDLENLYITASDGRQVLLKSIANISYGLTPALIEHDGIRRVMSINGFYRKNGPASMDLTMEVQMRAMSEINFPPG